MKRKWKSGDSPGRRNPGKPKDGLVSASVKRPKAFDVTCPTVSEAEVRILNCLVGRPPQGMAELLESLDMSRAAITGLLNDLAANGYVEKTVVKNGGRGRPQFLFAATKLAMRDLFENAREVLSPAVWQTIRHQIGNETLEAIHQEVADKVAAFYERHIRSKTSHDRLREMIAFLLKQGRPVEVKENEDSTELSLLGCPFASMVEESGSVCRIHLFAIQKLVGNAMTVALISHRNQEGRHCCVFLFRKNENLDEYHDRGIGI